jgi:adenylate kinase family enzyme
VKRVAVVGTSGSGKTTVGRKLAATLGVPYIELDALHHIGPNWTEASADELSEKVADAIAGDGWVVDGNYEGKIGDLVVDRADTLVWLDLPLRVSLARLWWRTSRRIRDDVELWGGNKESWKSAFWGRESLFAWTIRSHVRRRRTMPARLARLPHLRVVHLRTQAEVDDWLARQAPSREQG